MFCKKITFKDFMGQERTQDFWFGLTQTDITRLDTVIPGGLKAKLEGVMARKDGQEIMDTFDMLIEKSYGVLSDDGVHFRHSPEIAAAFMDTNAYDRFFVELVTDPNAAAAFVNGIMPPEFEKILKENEKNRLAEVANSAAN